MLYGLDFGTSNSAISVLRDAARHVEVLPIDTNPVRPEIMNTLIYLGRDGRQEVGRAAVDAYYRDNVGRDSVKQRVVTKEIIKTVVMTGYVDENFSYDEDITLPGRFFQALKSLLSEEMYAGTDVWGKFMSIEDLIAIFLRTLKERADAQLGQEIGGVVLGRPVFFSTTGGNNELAQERLERAAKQAGFAEVHFQYEPVAAALYYEMELAQTEEIVLVFDFGGGTLDTTLVRVGPQRHHIGDRRDDILATSGRAIGGNTFDEVIMEQRLFKYFGENSRYSEQRLTLPHHIFEMLRSWYTISSLQERAMYEFLDTVARHSDGRKQVKALECLIRKNYGYPLFQEIERAKTTLSDEWETRISFFQEAIAIDEFFSRTHFETMIAGYLRQIEKCLDETLEQAAIKPEQIGAVLRTGGSSYIPAVQRLLERKFGRSKLRFQDAFSNVASGLGVAAAHGTWI